MCKQHKIMVSLPRPARKDRIQRNLNRSGRGKGERARDIGDAAEKKAERIKNSEKKPNYTRCIKGQVEKGTSWGIITVVLD